MVVQMIEVIQRTTTRYCFACGLARRNCDNLFLDMYSISALELLAPAICLVTMWISNVAAKNHKDLSNSFIFGRAFCYSLN